MISFFDRETLDELRLLREEAQRLGTDPECFAANFYGMTLDQYRIWISTGEKPVRWGISGAGK